MIALFLVHFFKFALVDMGITPHIPTQNRMCPIKAYGFSFYIHTLIYKTDLFLFLGSNNGKVCAR